VSMGNCLGAIGEGTPAATAGTGVSFKNGDFTSISFIGLKDQGKRSIVTALASIIGCDLSGTIDERNRCILKFTLEVDGVVESVRVMVSSLEDLQLEEDKPEITAFGEVDVFAFTWSVENTMNSIKENFSKYFMHLATMCINRGDVGIFVIGSQSDKKANVAETDFQSIYNSMQKRDIDFHYASCSNQKQDSIKNAVIEMIKQRRVRKWSDQL